MDKTEIFAVAFCLALVFSVVAVVVPIRAAIHTQTDVGGGGTVVTSPNVAAYKDGACTQNLTSITWGQVAAGSTNTQTFYVKNTGTGSLTLNLTTSAWTPPAAAQYLTVSWNREGTVLAYNASVSVTVSLTVSLNVMGVQNFTYVTTVSGTG